MVKNYKKKPLNAATSGYTPPPPTGTPIYQPDEEAEIPAKKNNLPPRRMNAPVSRPARPMNVNSVPPPRFQQNNNGSLPNSLPTNYGRQQQYNQGPPPQAPPRYSNPPPQQNYNQPQYNQSQQQNYNQQYNQQPHYSPPQQYSQPPQQYSQPPVPQRYHNTQNQQQYNSQNQQQYNNSYQQQPSNGPMIPPRRERYETNYNTTGNPNYSEPSYRMPFPK